MFIASIGPSYKTRLASSSEPVLFLLRRTTGYSYCINEAYQFLQRQAADVSYQLYDTSLLSL